MATATMNKKAVDARRKASKRNTEVTEGTENRPGMFARGVPAAGEISQEELRSRLDRILADSSVRLSPVETKRINGVLNSVLVPGNTAWNVGIKMIEQYWGAKAAHGKARPAAARDEGTHELSSPAASNRGLTVVKVRPIETKLIHASPFQPRQDFDEAYIKELAESINRQGLLVPIVVRPSTQKTDLWELVFGECRFRAAELAGIKQLRAEIVEASDAAVREAILDEALRRKDLNPIELARAFRTAIDAGDAAGPTELAKQRGLSQGHISNTLRLLKLPAKIQAAVISQKIPATHALHLVPFAECPGILAAVDEEVKRGLGDWPRKPGDTGTVYQFEEAVLNAAENATRPMSGKIRAKKSYDQVPVFVPSEEERQRLGIVEIKLGEGKKEKPEPRATNVKLWEELQAAHEERLAEKKEKKESTKDTKGAKAVNKPLTPAQQKQAKDVERQREKERARKLAVGEWSVAIDWRRMLIARACRERDVSPQDTLRLLIYFAASMNWQRDSDCGYSASLTRFKRREAWLGGQLKAPTVPLRIGFRKTMVPNILLALYDMTDHGIAEQSLDFLAAMFFESDTEGAEQNLPDEDVLAFAENLGIDLTAAWKKEAAGELTQRWIELHSKEQLADMAAPYGVRSIDTKTQLVEYVLKNIKKIKPPAELLKPKNPKG